MKVFDFPQTSNIDLYLDSYIALKAHFNSSYDWFKYNGKVSRQASAKLRNDFKPLSLIIKKYSLEEFSQICLANLVHSNSFHFGKISNNEQATLHTFYAWKGRIESLSYLNTMASYTGSTEITTLLSLPLEVFVLHMKDNFKSENALINKLFKKAIKYRPFLQHIMQLNSIII
jgi:hypothetical protein